MELLMLLGMIMAAGTIIWITPVRAFAHCDTMDGPTAKDGQKALESGNINYALKWIQEEFEGELKEVFELSRRVRGLNEDAKELADRYFIENLIRIHRAGEGASYGGVKPHGVPIDEKVAAADQSIATGTLKPLEGLVTPQVMQELDGLFEKAMALKDFDPDDVPAARDYIEAYVHFFKKAEGENHEDHPSGSHGRSAVHTH